MAARYFLGFIGRDLEAVLKARMYSKLVIAELKQSEWPIDVYDSLHRPLRPVRRNGQLIGAYSVGPDGLDHGGKAQEDIYLELYGPQKEPTTAIYQSVL
jgi:hypothetical protein